MLLMTAALASAICQSPVNVNGVLDTYHQAAMPTRAERLMRATYSYKGQGLVGTVTRVVDLQSGSFVEEGNASPNKWASGYDGRLAWMRDLSDVTSPEQGGDKPALARNAAYRNANLWWAPDRGGAMIKPITCDTLRITPRGGKPFDARFDPVTHLLMSLREDQSFGLYTTTEYSSYERRGGYLVPMQVVTMTNGDPGTRETMRLSSLTFSKRADDVAFRMPERVTRSWSLPAAGRVTVPIRLVNNHVVADVRVNGRGPFPFLVDTGGHDIITPETLGELGLPSLGASPSFGAGNKAGSNGYAYVDSIDAGGAVLRDQTVITLDFSPKDVEGIQLGGMLGVEFIERFVVRIDYGAKTMTLIDPDHFSPGERQRAGVAIPFAFYDHMPQVLGTFDGRPARLDIDTGSRADVTMTTPFVQRESLRTAYTGGITITDGWGVGGPSHSYVVRVASLGLGAVDNADVIAGFSSATVGAFADGGSEGNVGSGLLKRFSVTFDYSRQVLYLRKLANPDPDTGRFDRVGMWLNQADGGLRVMDVASGGPAAQAGLEVGDIVTGIDGTPVRGRTLSNVRHDLKLVTVGKPLPVAYLRKGETKTATVVPRNLIPDIAAGR